jgi:hypothetical protein
LEVITMSRPDPAVAAVCRIADRYPDLAPPSLQAAESWVTIRHHLNAARRAVETLAQRSIPILQVRIDPRKPRPFVEVESCGGYNSLDWVLYAWGTDSHGHYRRYATTMTGCMITREERRAH